MTSFSFHPRTLLFTGALLISASSLVSAQSAEEVKINAVQGTGEKSPFEGKVVTVRGVVTADLRAQLGGVTLQSGAGDVDDNPQTSEGIFVKLGSGFNPKVGDLATVTGTVVELKGVTTLDVVQKYEVSLSTTATPVELALPLAEGQTWECYESMLVTLSKPMVVTEMYNYGRYGSLQIAPEQRLFQPTNFMAPGPEAYALQGKYATTYSILLDDGNMKQNPSPLPFSINGEQPRNGDRLNQLTGVVCFYGDSYQFNATAPLVWERTNPRVPTPPAVGGTIQVASYNVLNFFNGNGQGGGFPTDRGADSLQEFERQKAKIAAGIVALNADVVGLLEIENDGYDEFSAVQELVNAINARIPFESGHYAFVRPESSVGTDAICNAMIYRPSKLEILGNVVTLNEGAFKFRRPSLIVSFITTTGTNKPGEAFTVAVNHFKSKSCGNSSGRNADANDGQSCYNDERVQAANLLVDFLKTNPTGIIDEDQIIIGDLNSYAQEDPIQVFRKAGFHEVLTELYGGQGAYSFTFQGRSGLLDYAILSSSAREKLTSAAVWHINSDEAPVLDYNLEYKSADLYDESPFRSSDHDPVIFGLQF